MNTCPRDAITMQPIGPLQHIYPAIDPTKCIDCGLCAKTCPVNRPLELHEPIKAYAAISRDKQDLMSSSSGGAASVCSQYILKQGGIVYGCVQKNYRDIAHRRVDKLSDAPSMKGSKYVQSDINLTYRSVKQDLKAGRQVLFTGTPCQVAGLRAYLRKDYENLYLVDLVCHGVPSQHLLRENVEQMQGKIPSNPPCVHFRRKGEPLARMFGVFLDDSGTLSEKKQLFLYNDYITAFMCGITFRPNCYTCPYARRQRCSDVTISDFWGVGNTTVPTKDGISLMLQNTKKGAQLIAAAQEMCQWQERPIEEAIRGNGQLQTSFPLPPNREMFEADYARMGPSAYKKHLSQYRSEWKIAHKYGFPGKLHRGLCLLKAKIKAIPGATAIYHFIKQK